MSSNEGSSMNAVLLVLCERRELNALLDTFGDWKVEGAQILLHGVTNKAKDGFVLMHWSKPIPEGFKQKQLQGDKGILDFLVYECTDLRHVGPA